MTFEERLRKLEMLGETVRNRDTPLEEAVKAFEQGMELAGELEKELAGLEQKVEVLLGAAGEESPAGPELAPFDEGNREGSSAD